MDCSICVEQFTGKNYQIKCNYCDIEVCKACVERYLLESLNDPHCMGCSAGWNKEFLYSVLPKKYVNSDLKKHREDVLLEREKAIMPFTVNDVEQEKLDRQNKAYLKELKEKLTEMKREMNQLKDTILEVEWSIGRAPTQPKEPQQVVRKCPMEQCRGFLNNEWKCGTCETKICKHCNEEEKETHECNPETVETVKMIVKNSKPCPGCGMNIQKSEGCSQMWCTECHTTFDYNTGKRVHGHVHNPHYYEFIRQGGHIQRNPLDIECGGLVDASSLSRTMKQNEGIQHMYSTYGRRHFRYTENNISDFNLGKISTVENIISLHRVVSHVIYVELPHYNTNNEQNELRNLRVQYMLNDFDENTWKKKVQAIEKKNEKKKEFSQIITMFSHVSSDLFRKYMTTKDLYVLQVELKRLVQYTNEEFSKIGKRYSCSSPSIGKKVNYHAPNKYKIYDYEFLRTSRFGAEYVAI